MSGQEREAVEATAAAAAAAARRAARGADSFQTGKRGLFLGHRFTVHFTNKTGVLCYRIWHNCPLSQETWVFIDYKMIVERESDRRFFRV